MKKRMRIKEIKPLEMFWCHIFGLEGLFIKINSSQKKIFRVVGEKSLIEIYHESEKDHWCVSCETGELISFSGSYEVVGRINSDGVKVIE